MSRYRGSKIRDWRSVIGNWILVLLALSFVAPAHALTLSESIDQALKSNPQVIASEKRVGMADAQLGQTRSQFFPSISLDASLGKAYSEPVMGSTPDEAADLTTYTFTLRQLLFAGTGPFNAAAMSYYNHLIAKEDLKRTKADIAYRVAEAYYNVIRSAKAHDLATERVDTLKRYARQSQIFYDSNLLTQADVLRVETELASAKQAEIQAESGEKISRISFNSLLGVELSSAEELSTNEAVSRDRAPSAEALLDLAYANRPEWISIKLAEEVASNGVPLAYSGYFPTIALIGSTGKTVPEYPEAELKYDLDSWTALISASWLLFDGFNTPNKVYEANANLEAIRADQAVVKDSIAVEVTSAFYELESARRRAEAAGDARDLARRMLHFAELNYSAHIGTSLQVLDAEQALHKAENDLLSAEYDMKLAGARLEKVAGTKEF
jgi:outer membrane protein